MSHPGGCSWTITLRLCFGVALAMLLSTPRPATAAERPGTQIASVNVASDEILLALAPERLVALSILADGEVSNASAQAARIPTRGGADAEQILALRPDVVVIGAGGLRIARVLEEHGVRVVRIEGFTSVAWTERLIRTLGEIAGATDQAEEVVAHMRSRIARVQARVRGRPAPAVLSYSAWGGTAGHGTLFDELLRAAGGANVAARHGLSGLKQMSLEQVVAADPDVIVFAAWRRWAPHFGGELIARPALHAVCAIRERRVYPIPGRLMAAASHHVAETVEVLAHLLHPAVPVGSTR